MPTEINVLSEQFLSGIGDAGSVMLRAFASCVVLGIFIFVGAYLALPKKGKPE